MATARVLVVEDEALVAEEIRERLRRLGHDVVGVVDTGRSAVDLAGRTHPDVVLMDIRLKGDMDGIEAADHIHEKLEIPVVYVTAHADEATVQRAWSHGLFGYLVKPLQQRDLMMAIGVARYRHMVEAQERQRSEAARLALIHDLSEKFNELTVDQVKARLAVNATRMGLFELDVKHDRFEWDDTACRIFGFAPGTMPRDRPSVRALVHPDDRERVAATTDVAIGGGLYQTSENRIVRPDGTVRWIACRAEVTRGADGAPARLVGGVLDVTEERELDERRRQSQKLEAIGSCRREWRTTSTTC